MTGLGRSFSLALSSGFRKVMVDVKSTRDCRESDARGLQRTRSRPVTLQPNMHKMGFHTTFISLWLKSVSESRLSCPNPRIRKKTQIYLPKNLRPLTDCVFYVFIYDFASEALTVHVRRKWRGRKPNIYRCCHCLGTKDLPLATNDNLERRIQLERQSSLV